MPFIKPYDYTIGQLLTWSGQESNDRALRKYINQEISSSIISDSALTTQDIRPGRINPLNNSGDFVSGCAQGLFNDTIEFNRSYFTCHTKTSEDSMTSPGAQSNQPIWECGGEITLYHRANVLFTLSAQVISSGNDNIPKGMWDSLVYVLLSDGSSRNPSQGDALLATRSWTFEEEDSVASAGVKDPGGGSYGGTPATRENWNGNRRYIQVSKMFMEMDPGTYRIWLSVNPKVEIGYSSGRSWWLEVFYDVGPE